MNHIVDTIVVGAGHAGLATSRLLTAAGREHVVLDSGRVGERWRSERWDSLHLLTPSWMTRLPGWCYSGPEPDGYLSAAQFIDSLERYAASFGAPVVGGTTVRALTTAGHSGYEVRTDDGSWHARQVVLATGPHGRPRIPAGLLATELEIVPSNQYRNPSSLPGGGVLVIGASASGVQIADELARAGRRVVLAVGRHTRLPRRYRGMDIFWWLERTGRLARTIDEMPDREAARREPSLQLVGRTGPVGAGADLDLGGLQRRGVQLAGRFTGVTGRLATFADDLAGSLGAAEATMRRFLDAADRHIEKAGLGAEVSAALRPTAVPLPTAPRSLDLRSEGIRTVVVAAGYQPDHSWVELPITDGFGAVEQYRGVTRAPGVYVVGQRFQHRRDSGFIDGARHSARDVVAHLMTGALPVEQARVREGVAA